MRTTIKVFGLAEQRGDDFSTCSLAMIARLHVLKSMASPLCSETCSFDHSSDWQMSKVIRFQVATQ